MRIGDSVVISKTCPVKVYRGKKGTIASLNRQATTGFITHCYIDIPYFNLRPKISVNNLIPDAVTEFFVGDIVKIRPSSRYDHGVVNNPSNTEGEVTLIREGGVLPYYVSWPNNGNNTYALQDLVLVSRAVG